MRCRRSDHPKGPAAAAAAAAPKPRPPRHSSCCCRAGPQRQQVVAGTPWNAPSWGTRRSASRWCRSWTCSFQVGAACRLSLEAGGGGGGAALPTQLCPALCYTARQQDGEVGQHQEGGAVEGSRSRACSTPRTCRRKPSSQPYPHSLPPLLAPEYHADFEARRQSMVIEGVHLSIGLVVKLMQVGAGLGVAWRKGRAGRVGAWTPGRVALVPSVPE